MIQCYLKYVNNTKTTNLPKQSDGQILVFAPKNSQFTINLIAIKVYYNFAIVLTGQLRIVNFCHRVAITSLI